MMPRAIAQIVLGIVVQILAISCWFATGAALPSLTTAFRFDDVARVMLVVAVQAGFAVGAVLVAWGRIADRVRASVLVPLGAFATAAVTVVPLFAPHNATLLFVSRVLVGLTLAAVYPAGMRATVSWATPRWRGLAVAGVVASLTIGTAAPQLLRASPIEDWRVALAACAAAAAVAGALGLMLREGPYVGAQAPRAPRPRVGQLRVSLAYVGHMWEVYGLWVWLPIVMLAVPSLVPASDGFTAFALIGLAGAAGCLVGGLLAARYGKHRVAQVSALISGVCALLMPLVPLFSTALGVGVLAVWSAAAIADSALYSALIGDVVPPARVGTALAVQMGVGYALSIAAIALLPLLAAATTWPLALTALALGPLLTLLALTTPREPHFGR